MLRRTVGMRDVKGVHRLALRHKPLHNLAFDFTELETPEFKIEDSGLLF